ncbi:hypothetical protein OUZ56_027896 [Daphnia magna]|uniref:Uncharacterized protein n=1 Tax=Daphnia magna TaxID=35525 RepID=A0ABR0B291_9CRUS|nr:hypothetical protein OUZ56_027896 [Daphnia magna]
MSEHLRKKKEEESRTERMSKKRETSDDSMKTSRYGHQRRRRASRKNVQPGSHQIFMDSRTLPTPIAARPLYFSFQIEAFWERVN